MNAENHSSRYNDVALSDGEPIHPCAKYAVFSSECDFPEKYSKFQKFSCLLSYFSGYPGLFVPDAEINSEEYVDLPFICNNHFENISSYSFHKHLLSDHGKHVLC